MARFIDFDAAFAEQRREPVVARLFGRDWDLYPSIPASVTLELLRRQAEGADEMTTGEQLEIIKRVIPPDVLTAWLDLGLDLQNLATVILGVMRAYAGADDDEEESEGEAPAPAAAE